MEKIQAGSLTEEFSFSRALHLMRRSGAKVRCSTWGPGDFLFIDGETIFGAYLSIGLTKESINHIDSEDIMGNWTLYDEEIHG